MNEIRELTKEIMAFTEERDWNQFHSPENLAKSIAIEAVELFECYQWNNDPQPEKVEEKVMDGYAVVSMSRSEDPEVFYIYSKGKVYNSYQ